MFSGIWLRLKAVSTRLRDADSEGEEGKSYSLDLGRN